MWGMREWVGEGLLGARERDKNYIFLFDSKHEINKHDISLIYITIISNVFPLYFDFQETKFKDNNGKKITETLYQFSSPLRNSWKYILN